MDFTLITHYSWWFLTLCILLGAVLAFLLYRNDKKLDEVNKYIKLTMFVLRMLSISLIAFYLLSPFVKTITTTIQKPIIIFAHDNSESVLNYCNNKDYSLKLKELLGSINQDFEIKEYSFGEKLKKGITEDYTDKETDIATALSEINENYYSDNVGALILATDGIYNKGNNPLYEAENMKFPIYTIALGDSSKIKDLAIQSVKYNDLVFLNNTFPLQVNLSAVKLKGEKTILSVYSGKKQLFRKNIIIDVDNYFKKINIELKAEKTGIIPLNIVVKTIKSEKNKNNNSKQIVVEVVDTKQKILILANSPHPDIAAIRESLKTNLNFETEYSLIRDFNKSIKKYNLIILHQLPSKTNAATSIFKQINNANIPTLYILGKQSDLAKLNQLNNGLKIVKGSGTFDNVQGRLETEFKLFELNKNISEIAIQAPPLLSPFGEYKTPQDAQILFYSTVKGIETTRPLIYFNNFKLSSNLKNAFVTGEGLWRWKLYDFKLNQNHFLFDEFINKTVKYLTLKVSKDRFKVKAEKIVQENRNVIFDAEVYNKSYELVIKEEVKLLIKDSEGKTYNYIFDKAGKTYTLDAGEFSPGNYSWTAETLIDEKIKKKQGKFTIVPLNIEADNIVANHKLLYQLASRTGGNIVYPKSMQSLKDSIISNNNIKPVSYSEKKTEDFINIKFLFFAILLLISAEWLIRKLYGTV